MVATALRCINNPTFLKVRFLIWSKQDHLLSLFQVIVYVEVTTNKMVGSYTELWHLTHLEWLFNGGFEVERNWSIGFFSLSAQKHRHSMHDCVKVLLTMCIWSSWPGPRPPAAGGRTARWSCSRCRSPGAWGRRSCRSSRRWTFRTETLEIFLGR